MTKLVALIVEDDRTFALPAWHRTILLMEKRGLLVTHVAVVPPRSGQYGAAYLSAFGLENECKLRLFALLERKRREGEPRTWDEMAQAHGLVVRWFDDAQNAGLEEFLRDSECDLAHASSTFELGPAIAAIPRHGVVVHHASVLPSCRGLAPYFWARLRGEPVGQSFQALSAEDLGAGSLLAQAQASGRATRSMLAFQVWTAARFPELALDATLRLLARKRLAMPEGVEASCYGLPRRGDRLAFELAGGQIACWSDLRLTIAANRAARAHGAEAPGTTYQFPEVLPLRVTAHRPAGKVIPMPRPRE